MNLVFVTTHLPPDYHYGGVVNSGNALISEIKKLIPNITVFCVSKNPDKILQYNSSNIVCSQSYIFNRWGFSPSIVPSFFNVAKKADVVAINGVFSFPVTVAGLICMGLRKRYVVSLNGGLLPHAFSIKKNRKSFFLNMFIKPILTNASFVHATSNDEYQNYLKLGLRTPAKIIPNGTYLPDEQDYVNRINSDIIKRIPINKKVVLFVGRLDPIKGLDRLLEAWGLFKKTEKSKRAVLVIAGPDERNYLSFLKNQARSLGIINDVIFLGMVESDNKWGLYKRADLVVCPSYSENFGLTIAEALGSGTPVIASKSTPWSVIKEIKAGKWIEADSKSLFIAIEEILCLPEEDRINMGLRGKRLVRDNFSWDRISQRIVDLYFQIAKA